MNPYMETSWLSKMNGLSLNANEYLIDIFPVEPCSTRRPRLNALIQIDFSPTSDLAFA